MDERDDKTGESTQVESDADRLRRTITPGAMSVAARATRTPQQLIEKADRALYRAKKSGKNMVIADVVRNR